LNERDAEEHITLHRQIYAFRLQEQERINYISQKNRMANISGNKGEFKQIASDPSKSNESLSDGADSVKSACSDDVE
jgi:hypothetical protein